MNDIPIIYEDDSLLAINKPAGLVVHSDGRTKEPTVVDFIRVRYPTIEGVGEPFRLSDGSVIARPGIVHRLDRETSGVLLIAKNQEAFMFLKRQFQGRNVKKVYAAFVHGTFQEREKEGTIDLPIGRSQSDFRQWAAGTAARARTRAAETRYKVIAENRTASFVELAPKTGRTHQIRVHMNAVGHPVIADKRYAPRRPMILGFERLALHAHTITFAKRDGSEVTIEAPLPEDFEVALEILKKEE